MKDHEWIFIRLSSCSKFQRICATYLVFSKNINPSLLGDILVVKCYSGMSDLLRLACHT